jgi:GxxExxY protein
MKPNELTHAIIGAAIDVHRDLGPGKTEAAYEVALSHELGLRGIAHQAQKPVPVVYKGIKLDCGYRVDALVENTVIVEAKSVEVMHPVHRAQTLTYLRLGGWKLGLLLNFNVAVLKDGIERIVFRFDEGGESPNEDGFSKLPDVYVSEGLFSTSDIGGREKEMLVSAIVAAGLEVHMQLGPGLLPSAYEACLCHELHLRGIGFSRKYPLPLTYKGAPLAISDEVTLLVGESVVVKPCAVFGIQPVHEAELLSQLRLGGWKLGLLLNFHSVLLKDGIRRVILSDART